MRRDFRSFPDQVSYGEAAAAAALKRYGMTVADNGSNWFITGTTDSRSADDDLNRLKDIPGSAFEVVRSAACHSVLTSSAPSSPSRNSFTSGPPP